jgi:hypothetical protein
MPNEVGKGKKVYIVTSGCYSDYGIRAVSLSKRNAQAAIDAAKIADEWWAGDAEIEVWPVDEVLKMRKFTVWLCGMLLDDGSIVEPKAPGYCRSEFSEPFRSRVEQCGTRVPCYANRPIVRVLSSVSQDHANKVAAEARQAWLRTKAGRA